MPWAGFSNALAGVAVPDNMLAAVVGTVMRCDNIKGAPKGAAVGARICWAKPGRLAGVKRRLSAEAAATTRRQSSSHTTEKNNKNLIYIFLMFVIWIKNLIYIN